MTNIDVTRLIEDVNPFDLSASIAERGQNAGQETWANAKNEATERPLDLYDRQSVRKYFKGFGAWSDAEIAAWSDAELDALVLQYAAGDLREAQALCPGDGIADVDWTEAAKLSEAGKISGNLYAADNKLFISLYE